MILIVSSRGNRSNRSNETTRRKTTTMLRSIKNVLTEREYKRIYPTGSKPVAFYGNSKGHKLKKDEGLKELTLRPIVYNVGTATYNSKVFRKLNHIVKKV